MLLNVHESCLLVIDMQARLVPALDAAEVRTRRAALLLQAARRLDVPILATEQYPAGLGTTIDSLAALMPNAARIEKLAFSAVREAELGKRLGELGRRRIVVCGAETHVCVLQTAVMLHDAGYYVTLAADAVGSRREEDRQLGLSRMRSHGLEVASSEMVVFEWLERAGTEDFRALAPLIRDD